MAILIEAEDLNLETYLVEDFSAIKTDDNTTTANAQGISLLGASDLTGTASLSASEFDLSGIYDLEISYFDENDGEARLQILVNDAVEGDLLLNENTSSGEPTEDNRRDYVIEDLLILPTDTITIRGTADGSEWARVDFINLTLEDDNLSVPVPDAPPLSPPVVLPPGPGVPPPPLPLPEGIVPPGPDVPPLPFPDTVGE